MITSTVFTVAPSGGSGLSSAAPNPSTQTAPAPEPASSPRSPSWPRRHRRALILGAIVPILILLAAGAGASWHFSSEVVVPDHSPEPTGATVEAVSHGRVVLTRSTATMRPGEYGIKWYGPREPYPGHAAGHAVIGAVLASNSHTVTRRLSAVLGRLRPGTSVALDDVYIGNPAEAVGLTFLNVRIPGELGPMPAWLIPARASVGPSYVRSTSPVSTALPLPPASPGSSTTSTVIGPTRTGFAGPAATGSTGVRPTTLPATTLPAMTLPTTVGTHPHTWAIVVHGLNGNREGDLYIAPTLHRAGLTTLMIAYRGDVGAPASPDGLLHMGLTEWRDLQAAARYALAHGAQRLILLGVSMGGAIVTQFMERSPLASRVTGLILDSPALDWRSILSYNATEMGLPSFAAVPVEWAIDLRIHPDWTSLDALDHLGAFHLPILLFQGTEDHLVPLATADAFARGLSRWVTYYRVPHADHFESWNVDPSLYDSRVTAFLGHIGV